MEDANETYPAGWTRVEITHDRAIVTYRTSGAHTAHGLGGRLHAVLAVKEVQDGHCSSGHVPPSFVYHVSKSGDRVFNYQGKPRNLKAEAFAHSLGDVARRAARTGHPAPLDATCVVFPLHRTAAGLKAVRDDTPAPVAAVKQARQAAKMPNFGNPQPRHPVVIRIDGLTPAQCFAAFETTQRDQRTFEILLPADQLQPGDVVQHDRDWWFVVENERISNGFKRRLTLRAEGRDTACEFPTFPTMMDFRVQRSTALTPAQRAAAREIWARMLRHDVGVSAARDAERAPSVVVTSEDLEIEALAADVWP